MKNYKNILQTDDDYNYVVTIVLIFVLIVFRIIINSNSKQNIFIAWINFLSIFYVLWRIYFNVSSKLKKRKDRSLVLKNQIKYFKKSAAFIIILILILMVVYSFLLAFIKSFYPYGSCINDILSLFALLFSIEDEKIINKLFNHYRLVI